MDLKDFMSNPDHDALLKDLWESHASWWQAGFTGGVDAEYTEQILPIIRERVGGLRLVLDVGGGEGQVSRAVAEVTGGMAVVVDPIVSQARMAIDRGTPAALGTAGDLPIATASVDGVVVCLVFEHVLELDRALAEVARVIRPGGRFLLLLNHPILQTPGSGLVDDAELGERYWRLGPYLKEDLSVEEVEKEVFIPFVHRPLSHYLNTAIASGFRLLEMLEPPPPPGFLARADAYADSAMYPRLMVLHFGRES